MENVFVVQCPECEAITAAYDPQRSDAADIGVAVQMADKAGHSVAFVPSPVMIGRPCLCEKSS